MDVLNIGDSWINYDATIILSEVLDSLYGKGGNLYLISPWISNINYPFHSMGLVTNIMGLGNIISLQQMIELIMTHGKSKVMIATRPFSKNKYPKTIFQIEEIEFLCELIKYGAVIVTHNKLHAKIFLGKYGGTTGSANITVFGRFVNVENGIYTTKNTNLYKELDRECKKILSEGKKISKDYINSILRSLQVD